MSLNKFISQIKSSDIARTNRYVFTILLPPRLQAYSPYLETLSLFASEITGAFAWNLSSKGESFGSVPYNTPYAAFMEDQSFNVTFLIDGNYMLRHLFDDWVSTSYNVQTGQVEYYDNLRTRARIELLNQSDIPVYAIECFDVVMDRLAPTNLANASKNLMELTVTFNCRYWNKVQPTPVSAIQREEPNPILQIYRIVKPYLSARYPQMGKINQKINDVNLGIRSLSSIFGI